MCLCEGSRINPFQKVGGPQLFFQKHSQPPHKKRTFPKDVECSRKEEMIILVDDNDDDDDDD